MAEQSAISWTDATFNPWWGCCPVSPGCALCYAERESKRYAKPDAPSLWAETGPRRTFGEAHWAEPLKWARKLPEKLGRRPRVFCSSMADIGDAHPVCAAERPKLWALIEATPELDWLLLTKRTATAREWLPAAWISSGLPRNVWFGFSAERQKEFDERWPDVERLPAAVRFCSYEPALGEVNFRFPVVLRREKPLGFDEMSPARQDAVIVAAARAEVIARDRALDWVIAGGESGAKARQAKADWIRSARDQATAAGVAFHFNRWGEFNADGVRVGRAAAGRLLDGRTWDEFPERS